MQRVDDSVGRAVRSCAAGMIGEVAHDLNNRLATMRETVGLLEDLARVGKSGPARTARAQASLDEQVGRALNIVRTLGGIAGALASPGGFDLVTMLGDLLALTERWAKRRSLRIERAIASDLPRAAGDPAVFLCLVHHLLERCADSRPAGGSLRVRADRAGEGIRVRLEPDGGPVAGMPAAGADRDDVTRGLALRLNGELTIEQGGGSTILLSAAR